MFTFLCKSSQSACRNLQLIQLYSTSLRKANKSISLQNETQESFTVRYLINQCGFSMERAVFASTKYVNFDKPDQPDSVISFLKKHGFTDHQIGRLVATDTRILSSNPQKTLLPKFLFLRSKGFSEKDLARTIVYIPWFLHRSLENCIAPSFNFIEKILSSKKDAILAISKNARILYEIESHVKPNIKILLGAGMSQSAIARLLKTRPSIFVCRQDKLKESVNKLQNMGMDLMSFAFGAALLILTVTCRATWIKKMETYTRWSCSEDDVLTSFKICPFIMIISEEKINATMSFFVHEIGWKASEVVRRYFMFTLSLHKRMIPRWAVYTQLLSMGLIKKKVSVSLLFKMKEDLFVQKFCKLPQE